MRILVTGSSGHLASYVIPLLEQAGHDVYAFDLPTYDVTRLEDFRPFTDLDWCIHLAGLKYADRAELDPLPTVEVNTRGTANVATVFGEQSVVASTCKAADPETVYGCSKLIAERITLEAGGRVVRLVNVLGSPGSVTDIWNALAFNAPLPVCDATRLFINPDRAARLFADALGWPSGRYAPARPRVLHMRDVARIVHPGRKHLPIPLRRGDRQHERLIAKCEDVTRFAPGVVQITGPHDPALSSAASSTAQPLAA